MSFFPFFSRFGPHLLNSGRLIIVRKPSGSVRDWRVVGRGRKPGEWDWRGRTAVNDRAKKKSSSFYFHDTCPRLTARQTADCAVVKYAR